MTTACKQQGGVKWAETSAPTVRVNQVGYLTRGPKFATLVSESPTPVPFEVKKGSAVVFRGQSTPRGRDEASGDPVHLLDFSALGEPGDGLTVAVDGNPSFPFTVKDDVYARLPVDALKYFYHNRSGVPITTPYVPEEWSRPAGHLSDVDVGCWGAQECGYRLDVSGGWYDAGDHGKYVVNGGISAWTLLALHERSVHLVGKPAPFADGKLDIPESGNGVPDLLDEVRFEVEFLLKMQVPDGFPLAGMAHHKVHDAAWTPLGIEPPAYTDVRALHPPSTAATLNLAAVAAQAARVFRAFDPAFADRCQNAAMRAWLAAEKFPDKFAPDLDNQGGGPYSDRIVTDEFFWAAAELFITTGHPAYLAHLKKSPHFGEFPTRLEHPDGSYDGDGCTGSMTWQSTAALGWISLAIVPNKLDSVEVERLRAGIVGAGRTYLETLDREGYRVPLGLGETKKYPWGSNSFVLNNMIVLSLAFDLTGERPFAAGVAEGMDYLLGRNPLLQSYISGYGAVPLQHPHHRFWANSLNPRYPPPPPGAVSGGPNSSLQDPQTKKSGLTKDLPPQKCFVDHIQAWSVNEVAINWNAPLTWTALFLDEWRGG